MNVTINGGKLNDAQALALYTAVVAYQGMLVGRDTVNVVGADLCGAYRDRLRELLDLMERHEHAATC